MLAVVFGCQRFYQYIYGKKVIIQSDRKPIERKHLGRYLATYTPGREDRWHTRRRIDSPSRYGA